MNYDYFNIILLHLNSILKSFVDSLEIRVNNIEILPKPRVNFEYFSILPKPRVILSIFSTLSKPRVNFEYFSQHHLNLDLRKYFSSSLLKILHLVINIDNKR